MKFVYIIASVLFASTDIAYCRTHHVSVVHSYAGSQQYHPPPVVVSQHPSFMSQLAGSAVTGAVGGAAAGATSSLVQEAFHKKDEKKDAEKTAPAPQVAPPVAPSPAASPAPVASPAPNTTPSPAASSSEDPKKIKEFCLQQVMKECEKDKTKCDVSVCKF